MTIIHGLHIEKKKEHIWIGLPDRIRKENISQIENRIESSILGYNGIVVLDLLDTLSIYSMLVALCMHIREKVVESGGMFYIANVSEKCQIQLELMNLDKILTIYKERSQC